MQRMNIDANDRSLWVLWSLETQSNFAPYLITWEKGGALVMSATLHGWVDWSSQQPSEKQRDFRSMTASLVCTVLLSSKGTKMIETWSLPLELTFSRGNRQKRIISLSVGC